MTKRMRPTELEEISEPEQQQAGQADPAERVFDFTGEVEGFDDESKRVYYLLRRAAILVGDESTLPNGKIFTQAQAIEILGENYEKALVADTKCCG